MIRALARRLLGIIRPKGVTHRKIQRSTARAEGLVWRRHEAIYRRTHQRGGQR